jgi:hypothetical protein
MAPRNSHEPELARHQVGVLALPAQPRRLGQRLSISGAVSTKILTSVPLARRKAAGHALRPVRTTS